MRNHDHHLTDQELLLALDHELPPRRQASVEVHLAQCAACRARRARIDHAAENVTALYKLYKDDAAVQAERAGRAREQLRSKLNEMADEWDSSLRVRLVSGFMQIPRRVMVGAALAATALLLIRVASPSRPIDLSSAAAPIEREALPVASLTPGASWHWPRRRRATSTSPSPTTDGTCPSSATCPWRTSSASGPRSRS